MSDAWDEIQAIKSKRNSLRERLEKRKKERQDILGASSGNSAVLSSSSPSSTSSIVPTLKTETTKTEPNEIFTTVDNGKRKNWICQSIEKYLILALFVFLLILE